MTEQELLDKIADLESKLKERPSWIESKLSEQGTQRGLMILVPIAMVKLLDIDPQTASDIVFGFLSLAAGHDIITRG